MGTPQGSKGAYRALSRWSKGDIEGVRHLCAQSGGGSPRFHGGRGGVGIYDPRGRGGQRVIGPPQRAGNLFVGRNQRSVTRALLAYGKEFTTAELLRFMYPRWALEQLRSWHWKSGQAGCRELRDGARSPAPEASAMARDPGKEPLAAQGVSHSGRSCAVVDDRAGREATTRPRLCLIEGPGCPPHPGLLLLRCLPSASHRAAVLCFGAPNRA